MLSEFWSGLGGKLAEQWMPAVVTPAFVFWAGGLLAWTYHAGWDTVTKWFQDQTTPLQIAILIAGLILVLISGVVIQRLTFPVLRLLEGYWPSLSEAVRARMVARQARHYAHLQERFQVLEGLRLLPPDAWPLAAAEVTHLDALRHDPAVRPQSDRARLTAWFAAWFQWVHTPLPPEKAAMVDPKRIEWEKLERRQQAVLSGAAGFNAALAAELSACEVRARRLPDKPQDLMPTAAGNILRAAERRISARFALDPIICWSRLWLVLPDSTKTELTGARASLNLAAQTWTWAALFLVWTIWAWWAPLVTIVVLLFSYYQWLIPAAAIYGDLLESAFGIHRVALYQALRWPLPATPADELDQGRALTQYLARGSDRPTPIFTNP